MVPQPLLRWRQVHSQSTSRLEEPLLARQHSVVAVQETDGAEVERQRRAHCRLKVPHQVEQQGARRAEAPRRPMAPHDHEIDPVDRRK